MEIVESISKWLNLEDTIIVNILISLIVIILMYTINKILKIITHKKTVEVQYRYRLNKFISYFLTFLALLIIALLWTPSIKSVSTFLGLLSAGLAISLKEPISNIAGWLFILIRRPFEVGDRVEIGSLKGDIIDIRLFQFTLLEIGNWADDEQSTGRIVHIPNSKILIEPCFSYSKGFQYIWDELKLIVTFESDWEKAKEILINISENHIPQLNKEAEKKILVAARKFMIFYSKLTPKVYTKVVENGVKLTIRYLCEPRKRRDINEKIWEEILQKFSEEKKIDFAYPTTRFYRQ
jgi:small-conductance mechanosensitive channel